MENQNEIKEEQNVQNLTGGKPNSNNQSQDETMMGVVAYITVIGLIIAYVTNQEKKNPFVQYHIRQSLGLALTGFVIGVVNVIPFLGFIISILAFFFIVYLWIMGLMNALNKQEKPVPLLGKKYDEWFKNI